MSAAEQSGGSERIPEGLTPDELRKEAERRELRDRAKWVADRRVARNRVVDSILAIPAADVRAGAASEALRLALGRLRGADESDQERSPTNGEISLAGPTGWWDEVRKAIPAVEAHEMLGRNRQASW